MNYTPPDENNNGIPDGAEQEASGAKYDSHEESYTVKTFWKNKPLGRTLTLRNKTGKTIAGGIAGIGSNFLPEPLGGWLNKGIDALITTQTGVPMDFLLDMSLLQMIIAGLSILIPIILKWKFPALKEKAAWSVINERLDSVADKLIEVVDEDSEKGKKITRRELKELVEEALKNDNTT